MGLCFQSGLAAAIPHTISTGHKRINPVNLLRCAHSLSTEMMVMMIMMFFGRLQNLESAA